MGKRHETIGIKQAIRFEWMQKAVNLKLAGLDTQGIRQELHEYLINSRVIGSEEERSHKTRTFVVDNLMKTWVTPDQELVPFRDAALILVRNNPSLALAAFWSMISAAYPFWYNVALKTGRLLALQDQVTHAQIINRLKEQYGDRQTVSRCAQYVIRSFVAWGVLKDSETNGCYMKASPVRILEPDLAILMLESALLASPEAKGALGLILNNPAFFPFQLPIMNGDFISQSNIRIDVVRYGLDDELLKIKNS